MRPVELCRLEVGRAPKGPVIGPLIIAIAACESEAERQLKLSGVKDSKLLGDSARERLAKIVRSACTVRTVHITAVELNELMAKKVSLNEIEAMALGTAMNKVAAEVFYVDSPDTDTERFAARLRKYYHGSAKIVSEHKAESKFPVVAAASIVAKSEREAEVAKIARELGTDFGSGYPSDARTIEFLKKEGGRPAAKKYIRTAWKTLDRLKQKKLGE